MANQYLSLALFIMLLAFFIVLNTISSYEESKAKPIMESLEGVFGTKVVVEDDIRPSIAESEDLSFNEGNELSRLEALFRSNIPAIDVVKNDLNGMMHVSIGWDDFKNAVMMLESGVEADNGVASGGFFLPALIALLRADQVGAVYHMDILLNISGNPARLRNQRPKKLGQIMKEMGTIAERLEQSGLPSKLFNIGLQKGEKDMVEIFFRRYVPFNPLGNKVEIENDDR